jgi:integrase
VTTLARHSLSQAVRRIVMDDELAPFTPHDLRRSAATIVQAARLPVDFVKALRNHNDKGVTGVYARWHMFEEKYEASWRLRRLCLWNRVLVPLQLRNLLTEISVHWERTVLPQFVPASWE